MTVRRTAAADSRLAERARRLLKAGLQDADISVSPRLMRRLVIDCMALRTDLDTLRLDAEQEAKP